MSTYRAYILWAYLFLFTVAFNTLAAQQRIFKQADLAGFPRGNVLDLLQDYYGFLWIATSDGLGKYDGHQLIDYRHLPYDSSSLSNNYISTLNLDQRGNLLIGTHNGINVYLQKEDRFIHLPANGDQLPAGSSDIVLHIMQDQRGWYWYGTYQGLFRRKSLTAPAEQILPDDSLVGKIPHKTVWQIHADQKGRLWIGSGMGLIVSDTSATQFKVYNKEKVSEHGLSALQTWNFAEMEDGTIYMGSESGVFRAEEKENGWFFHQEYQDQLSEGFVNTMFNDGDSILWVGTYREGLNEINLQSGEVTQHRHDEQRPSSLGLNQINSIFRDNNGLLWVGTAGTLQFTSTQLDNFKTVAAQGYQEGGLTNKIVKSILVDHKGDVWVGTYDGLNRLDAKKWQEQDYSFKYYQNEASRAQKLSHNNTYTLFEDSKGLLWVPTYRGLNYLDLNAPRAKQRFRSLDTNDGLPHYFTYEVQEISSGQYWVATYGKLARMYFNPEQPEEIKFDWFDQNKQAEGSLVNATVYTMTKDRFDRWWFGTFDGLSQHSQRDGQDFFDNYQHQAGDTTSLSNNSIRCFHLDRQGRLWVGTRIGLNLVIQEHVTDRATFRHFGMREGFPNDIIHFIEEDEQGRFWIGTNAGLVLFNPDLAIAGKPAIEKVYTKADGLTSPFFVFRASFKDKHGNLYLGTAEGLNYFHPTHLASNNTPPTISITQLSINGQLVQPSPSPQALLQKPLPEVQALELSYKQNQLILGFSAMDFYAPTENQYAYRLLGFHDNWLGGKGVHEAQYTRVPPGQYRFQVRAANSDGVWSRDYRELLIHIRPPWWRTTVAYLLYGIISIVIIRWIIRQQTSHRTRILTQQFAIENARQEERMNLRQKNAADFHDELGHRLTKISLFLELAKRNIRQPQELFAHFQKIKLHVDGLSSGMRDLIWALDPQKDNLLQTIMRLRDFGDQLFDYSPTRFQVTGITSKLENIQLNPDVRQQLLLLFKEVMHNCLKYAQATEARLDILVEDTAIHISFQDNGIGFSNSEAKPSGYGLKNMRKRAEKIGGELNIESSDGAGTTIHLSKIPRMG